MADRGRPPEYSADELLDLAIEVIAEQGLAGCTFRTLADRASTSTSTFTYRFGSRTNLIGKVLTRAYSLGWEEMELGELEHPDPIQRLYEIGLADLQLKEEIDPYKRAYVEILVAAPREPELMEALLSLDESFLSSYQVLIERAQEMGMVDPELDPYGLTLAVWSVIDGLNLNRYAYREDLGAEQLEFYFRRIFEGIIGRPAEA